MGFLACPICGQVCDGETGVMSHAAKTHEQVPSEIEMTVVSLAAQGLGQQEIARRVGLTPQRVGQLLKRSTGSGTRR